MDKLNKRKVIQIEIGSDKRKAAFMDKELAYLLKYLKELLA